MLAYALLRDAFSIWNPSDSVLEIFDVGTRTTMQVLPLGVRRISNLAVNLKNHHVFLCDRDQGLVEIEPFSGAVVHVYPVANPKSCVLSPNQKSVFVAGRGGLFEFDTSTGALLGDIPIWDDAMTGGLAIRATPSKQVGLCSTFSAHPHEMGQFSIASINPLQLKSSTQFDILETHPDQCSADVVFTDDRVLIWDCGVQAVRQVSMPACNWDHAATIRFNIHGSAVARSNHGEMSYSPVSKRAYVVTASSLLNPARQLAIVDPVTRTFQMDAGFAGEPVRCAVDSKGEALWVAVSNGAAPNTLDVLDVATGVYARAVYQFGAATGGKQVVELLLPADLKLIPKNIVGLHLRQRRPEQMIPVGVSGQIAAGGRGWIFVNGRFVPFPPPLPYRTDRIVEGDEPNP